MVSLLIATSIIKVKKHDMANAHVRDMLNLAPATTMEVTLPVPITYPTIKRPGAIEERKDFNLTGKDIFYKLNTCSI